MSGAGGRSYRAIPGPSVIPDKVLQAMHRAAPNIYAGELEDLTAGLIPDLARIARTNGKVALYICNGHGVWEASLANLVAPGERVLVLCTGFFGHAWANMAQRMGIETEVIDFGLKAPVDPQKIEDCLRVDKDRKVKAVLLAFVDTSTSVRNNVQAVRKAIDAARHPALLVSDCIASLGCDRFEMDAWGVDVTLTASQKGLMVPPGMGFVFFNEKAATVRDAKPLVSPYWDWRPRVSPELLYQYFCGTAPTHHLYGLRASLDMIHEEGLEAVWNRHERLSRAIWAAAAAWGQGSGALRINIPDAKDRSRAVTTFLLDTPDGTRLRRWIEDETGVTLGIGLGMESEADPHGDGAFRIGHMGHVNAHMVLGVLGAIEAGFAALNIAHGSGGVAAAARALAEG